MKFNVSKISYSQTWEDTDCLRLALGINDQSRVLTITSGGGAAFSLLCDNPQSLISVDSNPDQNHLAVLISEAARFFSYKDFLCFIGIKEKKDRIEQFKNLLSSLTPENGRFWEKRQNLIAKGVIHCGKLERYFRFFGTRILPLVVSRRGIDKMLQSRSLEEQRVIYNKYWNNKKWQLIMRVFFGKSIFAIFGRDSKYFSQSDYKDTGQEYHKRAIKGLIQLPASSNWILEYILTGSYKRNLPPYYNLKQWSLWKERLKTCSFITDQISTVIKQTHKPFTQIHLSDIFEKFTQEEFDNFFNQLIPKVKKGGQVCYWYNLNKHNLNNEIVKHFNVRNSEASRLWSKDKAFFYGGFILLEKR